MSAPTSQGRDRKDRKMSLEKPNYNDPKDRELYDTLWSKKDRTEQEDRFFKKIFHQEEHSVGLDGIYDD